MATTKRKQIRATILVLLSTCAAIVGLIVNVPKAIGSLSQYLPEWLQSNTFWLLLGIIAVQSVVIWLIWRKPEQSEVLGEYSSEYMADKLNGLLDLIKKMADEFVNKVPDAELFENLEVFIPIRIKPILGAAATREYETIISEAKARTGSAVTTAKTGLQYLLHAIHMKATELKQNNQLVIKDIQRLETDSQKLAAEVPPE